MCASGFSQEAGTSTDLTYVAVPEKYFIPSSALSFQSVSFSKVAEAGAPRSGGKLTCHGPSMLPSDVSTTVGKVRDGELAGERNTTNTVSHGARYKGTVVRPSEA